MNFKYCTDFNSFKRFPTRKVKVGNSSIGGKAPIRIQSMTNTDTLDTEKSTEQCIKIFDTGADFVRLTVQTPKHADNLANIKKALKEKGYKQSLIADVHFNPKVAEVSAKIIEKVRINPGNFVDINKTRQKTYTDEDYQTELDKIRKRFVHLINICKENGTALRIGANHGSLSSRIVDKYGDTPEGMVASVMEFLRIARDKNFHEIVISLKSSNTRVMVFAYRLLMKQMIAENMNYPLHLGVTEAGDGEDGRIKSAVGIGTLLADGLGDTIRVSLTENPEKEIPVAQKIINYINTRTNHKVNTNQIDCKKSPFEYSKRTSIEIESIGGKNVPVVIADLSNFKQITRQDIINFGFSYNHQKKKWNPSDLSPDFIYTGNTDIEDFELSGLKIIYNYQNNSTNRQDYLFFNDINSFLSTGIKSDKINFISVTNKITDFKNLKQIKGSKNIVLVLSSDNDNQPVDKRTFIHQLINSGINIPVISFNKYNDEDIEDIQIKAALDNGLLFIDGLIDGLMLQTTYTRLSVELVKTSFGILQASRSRVTKTEYISCPSCGRTLFDIQEVTKEIKKHTAHLKGVKIGIMGCIVNGPGEMADADYGYVGTGIGKVSLYKGQNVVKKNISSKNAVEELISLIKDDGNWLDK
ncbi:MAG: (E)-4-hydroxy-3-methylbut-2-enyl-diphosphate synthase [Bacteroidales bacterium]|nr:(E)-4-hydroxy-3-methylbut-2-enyl-diphosphate synthase [Bacteroidales bacterium]